MSVAEREPVLLPRRRRSSSLPEQVAPRADRVDELIRASAAPLPWVARRIGDDRVFRGRLRPGTAFLPARLTPHGRRGLTVGMASRPVVLRSVGVAHPIPPGVPWVVRSDAEWRLTVTEPTDLRLIHGFGIAPELVGATVIPHRPTRFPPHEARIVRAALVSATPVWVDANTQPVKDLAAVPKPTWRLVGGTVPRTEQDRENLSTFLLMLAWALEKRGGVQDPRFVAVVQHISTRLNDPSLSTDSIAEAMGVSRRTLQGLFAGQGGVAAYIRRLRLRSVVRLLTEDPTRSPDLDGVAQVTGLGSRRTLERAMRQVYGVTPRQARTQVLAGLPLRERPLEPVG